MEASFRGRGTNPTPAAYPYPPTPAYVRRGNVESDLTANAAGQALASTANTYQGDAYQGTAILMYKATWISFCQTAKALSYTTYTLRTAPYRLASVVALRDGVSTTTIKELSANTFPILAASCFRCLRCSSVT